MATRVMLMEVVNGNITNFTLIGMLIGVAINSVINCIENLICIQSTKYNNLNPYACILQAQIEFNLKNRFTSIYVGSYFN